MTKHEAAKKIREALQAANLMFTRHQQIGNVVSALNEDYITCSANLLALSRDLEDLLIDAGPEDIQFAERADDDAQEVFDNSRGVDTGRV